MNKNILIIVGTRPEVIKMAPVVKRLKKDTKKFNVKVCITGQHEAMLKSALNIFDISPDFNLKIMEPNQTLFSITSRIIERLEKVFKDFKPDLVIVHGDTTTTFSSSLASFYNQIKVAHVEAGLRTNNIYSPFPEEMNRKLTSQIAQIHFTPTKESMDNLLKEGVSKERIFTTGNTVIDSLLETVNKIKLDDNLKRELVEDLFDKGFKINKNRKIILITGHRRENFGKKFINICKSIKKLSNANPDIDFVYPVHLNPLVQKPVYEILSNTKNIYLIDPLNYESFIFLMNNSYIIMTDSGGVQEEAPSLGKPVLVLRENTERPEAVSAGTVKIVGTKMDKIIQEAQKLIDDEEAYTKMSKSSNPYGDGKAASRIAEFLGKEI
jgi:UDP-N-acetylglucosamine 2-epimerase (non-hydrolysing)